MADNQIQLQNARDLNSQSNNCKLDIDCFELLADWLPLVDLHSIGQTCKRLRHYAGYVFRQTYSGAYVDCKNGGIFIGDVPINGFCDFIENLSIGDDELEYFHFIKSNHFHSLKRIEFHNISFTDEKLACIKHILKKSKIEESAVVEDIRLFDCTIGGEFYEHFLQHCVNMKRLSLRPFTFREPQWETGYFIGFQNEQPLIGIDNSWMLRKFSNLEYVGLGGSLCMHQLDELSLFFNQHPKIRKLAIDPSYYSVWAVAEMGFVVDDLAVICDCFEPDMYISLYKTLSEQKFFKRLQLYDARLPRDLDPFDPSLELEDIRALDKYFKCFFDLGDLTDISHLTTLCFWKVRPDQIDQKIDVIRKLMQLEKVSIGEAKFMELEAFIIHLPKLNTITIKKINDGNIGISLTKWNRERQRLVRACKVTVYVQEDVYLAVKQATHDTNRKLIELKRVESYEWDHDFGYPDGRYDM